MPYQALQRPPWHGTPIEVGDLFCLHKNRREARAALFTHQLGWEVRLLVGSQLEVVQTKTVNGTPICGFGRISLPECRARRQESALRIHVAVVVGGKRVLCPDDHSISPLGTASPR